jgi:hypothetical protein
MRGHVEINHDGADRRMGMYKGRMVIRRFPPALRVTPEIRRAWLDQDHHIEAIGATAVIGSERMPQPDSSKPTN